MAEVGRRWSAVLPWLSILSLVAWARAPRSGLLLVATALTLTSLVRFRRDEKLVSVGLLTVLAGIVLALFVQERDRRLTVAWDEYWVEQEAEVIADLGRRLDGLLDQSITNVATLADEAGAGNLVGAERVGALRRGAGLAALAVYGADGVPLVWDGMHRGIVPLEVKLGERPFFFGQSPLFSYLYVTAPTVDGGTAVGAVLLRADLPGQAGDVDDLASSFHVRTGETLRLSTPDRARAGEIFDYMHEGQALFSLAVERPTQADRRGELVRRGAGRCALLGALAWLLLAVSSGRATGGARLSVASGLLLAATAPVDILPGLASLDAPGDLLLPILPDGTLARVVLVVAALALGAGMLPVERRRRVGWLVAGAGVALGAPLATEQLHRAASVGLLAGVESGWVAYQWALAALLSLGVWLALVAARGISDQRTHVALALGVAAALATLAAWAVFEWGRMPGWFPALWGVPVALAVGTRGSRASRSFATWVVAGVLGASLAIPAAWGHRLEARVANASSQVARMGTGVDPYLQFLLERLAMSVESLDEGGAAPAELLYRSWRESGMAETGYPVWMTLWTAGGDFWEEELRIGMGGVDRPVVANRFLDSAQVADTVEVRRFDSFEAHYMVQVPLGGGRTVTGVVPPLGTTGAESLLGPLFGSLGPTPDPPVRLVPLVPGERTERPTGIQWAQRDGGWRGELPLVIDGGDYQANYDIGVAGPSVLVARGALLLVLDLLALGILWWLGAWITHRRGFGTGGSALLSIRTFRARVTLALFAFFALSNLIFGSLAYRTIAGASQRASRVLAERAVNDAAASYFDVGGDVDLLASRVGADVLEYRNGELHDGSVEELVSLGLYEGWVPYPVFQTLLARESVSETASTAVGAWEYVTAYRRAPDGHVMAAPVPLQAGATAIQSRDVAELLSAAVLAGAALSFLLALLVGRALTRPIQTLRVASERVGSGNLEVRLADERPDEFGAVFEAFNRMVERLGTARGDLVRTSRRTEAIVEDAATGVLAFDASGVVTLANPAARSLLGLSIEVGDRLPTGEGPAEEFVRWMETYFRDGLTQGGLELQRDDRRIRIRARRISHAGPGAGAVVSLEDVTDELRTERVLAWGEMARQVAHEVKNPLTPIKLSVQHLRRAWVDGRSDFGDILTRNVEAMLLEIDRLAAIASSFSRFGAPRAAGEEPLSRVQLGSVVREVMALYGDGDGAVRFEDDLAPDLPLVLARDSEVKEVLVNLLENSRAAVRPGGRVRVDASFDVEAVVLRVVDDGVGIPEAFLGRVFEPHFSTRSAGTGLGLAIVHRLVGSWGGSVHVESREGEGTVVSIHFQVAPSAGVESAGGGGAGALPS